MEIRELYWIYNYSFVLTGKKITGPWVVRPVRLGAGGTIGTTLHQLVQAFVDIPASLKTFLAAEKGSLKKICLHFKQSKLVSHVTMQIIPTPNLSNWTTFNRSILDTSCNRNPIVLKAFFWSFPWFFWIWNYTYSGYLNSQLVRYLNGPK